MRTKDFWAMICLCGLTASGGCSDVPEPADRRLVEAKRGDAQTRQSALGESWAKAAKLIDPQGAPDDEFGRAVAASGDVAVVAAQAGAVLVFGRDEGGDGNWGLVKRLSASGDAVATSDDLIVVGNSEVASATGVAYLFGRDEGGEDNWGLVKELVPPASNDIDQRFGSSVALSGDVAVIGAMHRNQIQGAAFVYHRDEGGTGNWGQVKELVVPGLEGYDRFGQTAALSGDTAVIGSSLIDAQGRDSGAAYVFYRDEGGTDNWGQVTELVASDAEMGLRFAASLAMDGDLAVVGAFGADGAEPDAGAAYVFGRDQGGTDQWGQVAKLAASDGKEDDSFGRALSLNGERLIVGARDHESGAEPDAGAAYVFARDEGGADTWGEVEKLSNSDQEAGDSFGNAVALSRTFAVIGARKDDDRFGSAYIFDAPNTAPAASDDAVSTDEDTAVSVDVLANDSDPDSDPLSIDSVTEPSNGAAVNNGGDITYTPDADYHGDDTFDYTITDGRGETATATVTVTVEPVDDVPDAGSSDAGVDVGTDVGVDVGVDIGTDVGPDAGVDIGVDAGSSGGQSSTKKSGGCSMVRAPSNAAAGLLALVGVLGFCVRRRRAE